MAENYKAKTKGDEGYRGEGPGSIMKREQGIGLAGETKPGKSLTKAREDEPSPKFRTKERFLP